MTVKEFYEIVGGDYKTASERLMNDDFIKRMLGKFLATNSFPIIKEGFEKKDPKMMFEGAHSLKGVSGNLALTSLYEKTCVVVELVRDYQNIKELNVSKEMGELENTYLLIKDKIEELLKA